MSTLLAVLILSLIVITFGGLLLGFASIVGPKVKSSKIKNLPYECGLDEKSEANQVPIKFYLTAILFILFDVEIIFMLPWAITFKDYVAEGNGLYIFSVMFVFILLFVVGLIWEIKSKALEWE